jgi:hypothetical protein
LKNIFIILILFSALTVNAQWVQRYNSTGNYSDYVSDMAVDGQGNVYITGYSNGDFVTIKYNSSGVLRWMTAYDGPLHVSDQAFSIALDRQNNVYVLGVSVNLFGKDVYAVIKYSNNGEQLWVREYINSDSSSAYPKALSVDSSGNVYITGTCSIPLSGVDFGTVKYNTDGVFQWVRFYGGTANISDIPYSIAADKNGNVFVTGSARDSGNIYSLTTIKYDSLGNQKWVKRYYFQNNGYKTGIKILADINGNIFVAGYGKEELNTKYEFILLKYDTSGNEKWVRRYRCQSGSNGNAYLQDMVIDNSNNIYICGISDSSDQAGWGYTTLKYSNEGDWLWIKRYKKAFNSNDEVKSIAVDKYSNVFVTGRVDNNTPWYQYCTVSYSSVGEYKWAMTYNNNLPFNSNHEAVKVKTDSSGNVYVTGNSEGNGTGLDIATIKYLNPTGIINLTNDIPDEYRLEQNYPNPFNSTSNLKFKIARHGGSSTSDVRLIVYDIMGREVQTLVNKRLQPGTYETTFDGSMLNSGVYFYKLITEDYINTKRMILIK